MACINFVFRFQLDNRNGRLVKIEFFIGFDSIDSVWL